MKKTRKAKTEEVKQPPAPETKENTRNEDDVPFQSYLNRLFGEGEDLQEDRLLLIGKWVLFGLLVLVELLILLQRVENLILTKDWFTFSVLIAAAFILTVAEAVKLFFWTQEHHRMVFYFIEIGAACGFMSTTEGTYPIMLYVLILTQFYVGATRARSALWMYGFSLPLFAVSYTLQIYFVRGDMLGVEIIREGVGVFSGLTLHFLAVQILMTFYRQYTRLNRALVDLEKSKKELQRAYDAVVEVTALEERQRIAKEIHDTAGHSLTTVIMQTEAAKRIIDTDPAEAKQKLIAANLQAKNTLEKLRASVHVLSGKTGRMTLKQNIENIISETMDGTGITIRSDIEDITVSNAKLRFLCNALKEGISNGLRHGHARAFWLELKMEDETIKFLLSDNGSGLDTENFECGFGLTMMRDRARALGGEMVIVSAPDEGLELSIILPMDK